MPPRTSECAYTRYVVGSGLFTDELSEPANSVNFDYDRRTLTTNGAYGTRCAAAQPAPPIYTTLSTARGSADTVLARLREWTDAQMPAGVNRTGLIGQAATYAGYSLVLLGEGMCSAAINVGPELTPAQLFDEAKIRFDAAIVAATTANDVATVNLATLGRARTLLDLGQPRPRPKPTRRRFRPDSSQQRPAMPQLHGAQNYAFLSINANAFTTVDASFRGLTINGAPDPRVAVTNTGRAGSSPAHRCGPSISTRHWARSCRSRATRRRG